MKMVLSFFLIIFINKFSFAGDKNFVHHPAPKDPFYLKSGLFDAFRSQLPGPPDLESEKQKEDEKELFSLQKSRTSSDCSKAKEEVLVSLTSFFGEPNGTLKEPQLTILSDFFEQIRNDGDYFIQRMKKEFPRQRPFNYIKGLSPCVAKEVTGAYPSGHATLAKLYALILTDFIPADKEKFENRAIEIGKHRVLSGMHHPTDIEAGRKLAGMIYNQLKDSKKYQIEFKKQELALKVK